MKPKRWYEKSSQLKIILQTLETLKDDVLINVANDIIQIILEHQAEFTDEFIEKVNNIYYPLGRRWYDKNQTISSAIEMIKHVDDEQKPEILTEILYSILYFSQITHDKAN